MADTKDKKYEAPVLGSEDEADLIDKYEEIWDLDLSKKQIDFLLTNISQEIDDYEKHTKDDREDIYKWEDQYEGNLVSKDFPWEGCANYHVPITEYNVNALYSRVIKRFRTLDYLRVKAYQENKEEALLTQKYLRYLFEKRMHYTDLCMSTYRDIFKFGSGVYITTWEYLEKKKKVVVPKKKQKKVGTNPMTGEVIYDEVIEYVIEEQSKFIQRPKIEWVDLLDYFRSEETNRFAEPTWEARRIYKSPVEFLHCSKYEGYDEDNVKEILKTAMSKQPDDKKSVEACDEREVIEVWGWFRLDDDPLSEPERIVFTYDRGAKKFLKAIRFPYFFEESNFTVINTERRSTTWRGRGYCQKLEHVNREMDKLHDLYIDSCAIVTSKSFKKKKGADTNFLLEPFYPGVVWEVSSMDAIEVMDTGDMPIAPINELKQLDLLASKQTGIGGYQVGQDTGGPSQPTASGQLAVIQEGNISLDETAKEFTYATIRMARQVLQMVKQFRPEDEFMEVMTKEETEILNKVEVDIDKLIDDPDLIIVDRSVLEEQEFKTQAVELYNMVRTDPALSRIPRIYIAAVKNMTTAYKTMDADLMVPTEEELAEAMQNLEQQAIIANMQVEMAKQQTALQLAQIKQQTDQAKLAAQQQQQQQALAAQQQQGQADLANKAAQSEADRKLALEQQGRDQDFQVAQKLALGGQPEEPAA